MADLGSRLLSAGLVTRAQLARALSAAPPHGGALVEELVRHGVDEDALAGFFIAEGFGPLMEAPDLEQADEGAVRSLAGPIAEALLALPVRSSPGGLVVAMADPSDTHALSEVRYAVGNRVLPTVARLSDLRSAIQVSWPDLSKGIEPPEDLPEKDADPSRYVSLDEIGLDEEQTEAALEASDRSGETPIELVRRRQAPDPALYVGSTRDDERADAKRHHLHGRRGAPPSDDAVPLVRPKVTPASGGPRMIAKRGRRKTTARWGRSTAAFDRSQTADYQIPPDDDGAGAEPSPRSDVPPPEDRWGDLSTPSSAPPPQPSSRPPSAKLSWRARASIRVPAPVSRPPGEIGTVLAGIRGAGRRDEILRLACEGAMTVGRCAVLLAVRRGNLVGRVAVGAGVSEEAIRNLVIPVSSPSIFQSVVTRGEPHHGPLGHAAADVLFRAAVGSRGGDALAVPIVLSGRTAAVLCVDDLRHGDEGRQRVEVLAHAVGEAFKRIIVANRTGS